MLVSCLVFRSNGFWMVLWCFGLSFKGLKAFDLCLTCTLLFERLGGLSPQAKWFCQLFQVFLEVKDSSGTYKILQFCYVCTPSRVTSTNFLGL